MKKILFILTLIFLLPISSQAQLGLNSSQSSVWLSAGWGGGESEWASDSYPLFSLGTMVKYPNQLFILRGQLGGYPLFDEMNEYKISEVTGLWGYLISFDDKTSMYLAYGATYSIHQKGDKSYLSKSIRTNDSNFTQETVWSIPIEFGVIVPTGPRSNIVGSAFINLLQDVNTIGYLVQYQYRLF